MKKETLELLQNCLTEIQCDVTKINMNLKPENDDPELETISLASNYFITNLNSSFSDIGDTYNEYKKQFGIISSKMIDSINTEFKNIQCGIDLITTEIAEYKDTCKEASWNIQDFAKDNHKEPLLYFSNNKRPYKRDIEFFKKYPGSYFGKLFSTPNMWNIYGDIYVDHSDDTFKYLERYMDNDYTLLDDLMKIDEKEKDHIVEDLDFFSIPVKHDFIKTLCYDNNNLMMDAWKNRVVMVNGKNLNDLNNWFKENKLLDQFFNTCCVQDIKYDKKENFMYMNMILKYGDFINDYCKNKGLHTDLIPLIEEGSSYEELEQELSQVGISLKDDEKQELLYFFDERLLKGSLILLDNQFDDILQEWIGGQHEFKLVFRASEHNFSASSFHDICDNVQPTLVLIKSTNSCIFGGFATENWAPYKYTCRNDPNSFLFTLINPHNIPPTKYSKKEESSGIGCQKKWGPSFGKKYGMNIYISDQCDKLNSSSIIIKPLESVYEFDEEYINSLFVGTDGKDEENKFTVADYEVYTFKN